MSVLDAIKCALFGEPCPEPYDEPRDDLLRDVRAATEEANREADELRAERLLWQRPELVDTLLRARDRWQEEAR